jgi:hypothetical protein
MEQIPVLIYVGHIQESALPDTMESMFPSKRYVYDKDILCVRVYVFETEEDRMDEAMYDLITKFSNLHITD